MKRAFALLIVALPTAASAQSPIDVAYARSYFEELRQLGAADAGKLWGRRVDGPMLFADRATQQVVANVADKEGKLREENGVWVGQLPSSMSVSNTAIDWAGRRWSMVGWPLSDSRYARDRLLVHESFHRLQPALGFQANDVANAHLVTADARIWLRLEMRALTEALLRTGLARTQSLKDALVFRARRRNGNARAAEEERQLELNEGLAEYTGYVLSGLPRSALPDRIAVQLANYEQQDNFSRSFAYATGPAYGLLLDLSGAAWRTRLTAASSLSEVARNAYRIAAPDAQSAGARVAAYKGARMMAEERAREAGRIAREADMRKKLIDAPVLALPVGNSFNYSFDPNGAMPLADIGIAYDAVRVTDDWGVLNVTSGGVLLKRNERGITGVVVPVTSGATAPLKGEGWELQLAPGWSVVAGQRAGDWMLKKQ